MATRKLQPVPDAPPRAVIYIRQSVARDDSVSPDLQETACRDYARRQGYQVVDVITDLGISGRTWKRAGVARTMALIEDGGADVILLWKWSRLSRSRRDWAIAVDKVDVAGGRIESATEAVDVSTATGRLARGVLAEFAAFESDRIGEVWKEVHAERLSRGLVPNGNRRFGYIWDRDADLHIPHPIEGPALAWAYERFAAGESLYSIVKSFNQRGLVTTKGGAWSHRILRKCMDNGFAAGLVHWGGVKYPGAHEAVVAPDLWQAYLDRRSQATTMPPRSKRSKYLLSGMVRCGRCGRSMSGGASPQGPRLRCNRNRDMGPIVGCSGGHVQMAHVEAAVMDWLRTVAADVDAAADVVAKASAARLTADVDARRLTSAMVKVDEALARLTVQLAEELVPPDAYAAARDELVSKRAVLASQLEESGRTSRRASLDRAQVAADLLQDWDDTSVEVRRTVLHDLIEQVTVWTESSPNPGKKTGGSRSAARVEVVARD